MKAETTAISDCVNVIGFSVEIEADLAGFSRESIRDGTD
jgi:hypothetical protein